jgi:copper(I)-binding protein
MGPRHPQGCHTGAAYVTLINGGDSDDHLLGVSSPVAESAQFHVESNDNGMMTMARLATVALPRGTPVLFKPSGLHIMLLGLRRQLKEGETVPLVFRFERAATVNVSARVGKIGAMSYPTKGGN